MFLLILFPALFLHIQAREKAYHVWLAKLKEYEELIQKQGCITEPLIHQLGISEEGNFGDLEVEMWHWIENGTSVPVDQDGLETKGVRYLEEIVYPFHTGDMLEVKIRMPLDFFEKLYYAFCFQESTVRKRVDYVVIRDGVLERVSE